MDKDTEITQILASRQKLLQVLGGLSEQELSTPVEGDWTPRDLLAHIASWEETCLEPLRSYASGGEFLETSISDHEAFNEQKHTGWKNLTFAAIVEYATRVRDEFLALVGQVPAERAVQPLPLPWGEQAHLAQMVSGLTWHENEHTKRILGLRAANDAAQTFAQGFSCSQAVLSSYAERFGLERDLALKVSGSFGGGIARKGLTCGAVSGALMALGLKYGKAQAADNAAREENYLRVQDFIQRFEAEHGSITCNQLLGMDMNDPASRKDAAEAGLFRERCPLYVRSAARILAELV